MVAAIAISQAPAPPAAPAPAPSATPSPAPVKVEPAAPTPPPKTQVNPKDGLTYVLIPPGKFLMGCSPKDDDCFPDERTVHEVTMTAAFWLGQTDVTQDAYQRVIGRNPSHFKGASLPVETVTWADAQAYCQAVGGRLPTDAEWEYAARGGDPSGRYGALDEIAWYEADSRSKTHAVAQKKANAYGLFDMLGNVWQWTADWYADYNASPVTDPSGPAGGTGRTLRGGSWADSARFVRTSEREGALPAHRYNVIGFRCVAALAQ
jgi:formylglycine-generating enzyme required for sulfatase activity